MEEYLSDFEILRNKKLYKSWDKMLDIWSNDMLVSYSVHNLARNQNSTDYKDGEHEHDEEKEEQDKCCHDDIAHFNRYSIFNNPLIQRSLFCASQHIKNGNDPYNNGKEVTPNILTNSQSVIFKTLQEIENGGKNIYNGNIDSESKDSLIEFSSYYHYF